MKYVIYIASLLLACIIGWFIHAAAVEPKVIYETETVIKTEVDTLIKYVEQEPIVIRETAVVRDTIYTEPDGRIISTEIASLDTIFVTGAELAIEYNVAARDFKIQYKPAPVKIETIKETVTITEQLKPKKWVLGAVAFSGIILGAVIG